MVTKEVVIIGLVLVFALSGLMSLFLWSKIKCLEEWHQGLLEDYGHHSHSSEDEKL